MPMYEAAKERLMKRVYGGMEENMTKAKYTNVLNTAHSILNK